MQTSKFIKVDTNILIEYIYDDQNLIGEDYEVLVNIQDGNQAFMSGETSASNNTQLNSLFEIDAVTRQYGKVVPEDYNFLQTKDFAGGQPIRYDTIRVHFPINYTFGENLGFKLKVSAFDFDNTLMYDISNFFFDITDPDTFNILAFSTPPLLFQEKLWGKSITINVPSAYALGLERKEGNAESGSINANLTNNSGLSQTSPIFIDFQFLEFTQLINSIQTYQLTNPVQVTIPLTPDFENLGIKISPSDQGDFFEIFGIFNNSIAEFKLFIDNSFLAGHRYYVQYVITVFEENIQSSSMTFTVTDDFNVPIDFRPIIKFSTTTAVVDVEMKLIDAVDDSQIVRRGAYGMLPDEVSKYSLNLTKINLDNANKPKVYNLKNVLQASDADGNTDNGGSSGNVRIEQVKVPILSLAPGKFSVVGKSETVKFNNETYFGIGKLQILVYPFDNTIQFTIAKDVSNSKKNTSTGVTPMDLSGNNDLKLVFKNRDTSVESKLLVDNENVSLTEGKLVFKIFQSQIGNIRKVFDSDINIFYITTTSELGTEVIYSGTFEMYDSLENVVELNAFADQLSSDQGDASSNVAKPFNQETAIVTRVKASASAAASSGTSRVGKGNKGKSASGGTSADAGKAAIKNLRKTNAVIQKNIKFGGAIVVGSLLQKLKEFDKKTKSELRRSTQSDKDLIISHISTNNLFIDLMKKFDPKLAGNIEKIYLPTRDSLIKKLGLPPGRYTKPVVF